MIKIQAVALDNVIANFRDYPAKLKTRIVETMRQLGVEYVNYVRKNKLSGNPINSRTGALSNSIYATVVETGDIATITAGSRGVRYAGIQEYGGTVHIPAIRPVSARVLHWTSGGGNVFAMYARAHDVRIPERSYLRSSLREMQPVMISRLRAAISEISQ